MAQGYDSDVQLSVGLSLEDVKSQAEKLTSQVSKIFNSVDSSKLDSKMRKLQSTMSKTESQMESTYQKIAQLEQRAADTETFIQLAGAVESGNKQLEQLSRELQQAQQAGDNFQVDKITNEIQELTQTVNEADNAMTAMLDSGFKPFTEEDNIRLAEYKDRLGDLNNQQRLNIEAFNEMYNTSSKLGPNLTELVSAVKSFIGVVKNGISILAKFTETGLRMAGLGPVIDTIKGKFSQLVSKLKGGSSAGNSFANSMKAGLKKLFAYGLGIASLTSLFSKIRGVLKENIKYFAQFNNGNNQVNESISQLQSSLNALKGSLASAFLPIINVISPILSNFIDQIASVINSIGMLIARLTGAKSYMMAVKKPTDYAASQNKKSGGKSQEEKQKEVDEKRAGEAAKAEQKQAEAAEKLAKAQAEANKQLAGFDELNELTLDKEKEIKDYTEKQYKDPTASGGGGSPFDMKEVPLDSLEWNWDDIKKKAEELGRKFADFLNGVFKNEQLAKDIGHNIAEALNTALHFVYGFVDQLDWKQMGRWFGTLIQEGLETFEWDLLGETIGKTLNGIANTVIGFFETYKTGTLGAGIAEMLNNAIKEIDPMLLGEAVLKIIQAPFNEVRGILTKTRWKELGEKVTQFFTKVFTGEGLNKETLGTTIGRTLGAAINAAVDFLLGLDISQLIVDIGVFFTDAFEGAVEEIDWGKVFKGFLKARFEIDQGLSNIVAIWVETLSIKVQEALNEKLHFDLFPQSEIDEAKLRLEDLKKGLTDFNAKTVFLGTDNDFLEAQKQIAGGVKYSKEQLEQWRAEGSMTDKQIRALEDAMGGYAESTTQATIKVDNALQEHGGSWGKFGKDVAEVTSTTNANIESSVTEAESATERFKVIGQDHLNLGEQIKYNVKDVTEQSTLSTNALKEEMLNTKGEVNTYASDISTDLETLDTSAGITLTSFEDMATQLNVSLDDLTNAIQSWYDDVIEQYFGYDAWDKILSEGMSKAFEDTTDKMTKTCIDKINSWKNGIVSTTFNYKNWTTVFQPIANAWRDIWKEVWEEWNTQFDNWWTTVFTVKFAQNKWSTEFNHVYIAAQDAFKKVVDTIKTSMNSAVTIVTDDCTEMAKAFGVISDSLENVGDVLTALGEIDMSKKIKEVQVTVPGLATGAVIPPNSRFLAMLGDQTHGTNIEAPLDTIKQAVAETLSEMSYRGGGNEDIVVQIDGYEVFRAVRNQSERFRNSTGYGVL